MDIENRIKQLCAVFDSKADIGYDPARDEWRLAFPDAHLCTKMILPASRHGEKDRSMLAASNVVAQAPSLDGAVGSIERRTVGNGGQFALSSMAFGLFRLPQDYTPHIITVFEGVKSVQTFPYDEDRVRSVLQDYAP